MVPFVNLDEFSDLCGVTSETMRVHIRSVEGTPDWLLERGARGVGYKIDPEGGIAWWKDRREADETASAERQAQLQQLRFEHLGDAVEDQDALSLSGRQRREEIEAALARIKLRRIMGELVEAAPLEAMIVAAVIELRRQLMLVPAEFTAASGLSPAQVEPLEGMLEQAIERFVAGLPKPGELGGA